ncbi:hypothetical protein Fmac_021139 [Flemingia macrophylla]|uniref:Uncharacterized protein n=1 Tax=Flemingia macrophylla TaxID=520843 RepID=A0ABD1LW15_9FABA
MIAKKHPQQLKYIKALLRRTDEAKLLLDFSRDLLESSPLGLKERKRQERKNIGPIAELVYKVVRDFCKGHPIGIASLHAYLSLIGKSEYIKLEEFRSILPCSIVHPGTSSCLIHLGNVTSTTFKKTFPLYFSLNFAPFVVLHLHKMREMGCSDAIVTPGST